MNTRVLFSGVAALFNFPLAAYGVCGGPTYDALSAAAAAKDFPMVFDGAGSESVLPSYEVSSTLNFLPADNRLGPGLKLGGNIVPVPAVLESEDALKNDRVNNGLALDPGTEKPAVDKAIKKLASVKSGKDLADFLESEGVVLEWKILGDTASMPNYLEVCNPEVCGDRKVIYLNSLKTSIRDYKSLLLNPNPTFLAVQLAHELTHLSDLKSLGAVVEHGTQAQFFLELNGISAGVYVYHQLLIAGVAPKPNSPEETYELQTLRLYVAIRDYVNGGSYPDYREFDKIGGPPAFGQYVNAVTDMPRKGSMSLSGVAEALYGFPKKFEVLQKPPFSASSEEKAAYKQAKKIKRSLDLSTATYIKWRKATTGIPTPPPQEHAPWYHPPAGDDDGGGDNGGGTDDGTGTDVPPWIPGQGNGATWGEE